MLKISNIKTKYKNLIKKRINDNNFCLSNNKVKKNFKKKNSGCNYAL